MGHMKVHVKRQKKILAMKLSTWIENKSVLIMKYDLSEVKMNNAKIYNLKEVQDLCVLIDVKFKEVWKHF
jgi:hypothetical protein